MLEQSVSAYPGIAAWRAALAWALCWLDRLDDAAAVLQQAADQFDQIPPGPAKLTALALYADAAVQTSDRGAATILYRSIEPYAEQVVWNTVTGCGHARMWLGLLATVLGEHERADAHLEAACAFQESNGLQLWATRAHLGWAEALAARGDPARASEHANRALELARQRGYGLFERRATGLLGAGSVVAASHATE
jgi:tetratricopeptide (TPR) repeat protein